MRPRIPRTLALILCMGTAQAAQAAQTTQTAQTAQAAQTTQSAQAPQTANAADPGMEQAPIAYVGGMPPVMDHMIYSHALLDEFEARADGHGGQFRYDGQAWFGTDYDKLWLKSEGTVGTDGRFGDGDHEALYDHAISRYFDVQSGVRVDLDNGPTRAWGAVGVEGLALYFFQLEATTYFSDRGAAARLQGSYDLLLTNRLILQPQVEMNVYSTNDRARGNGRGLSDIDTGLRLRYEWHRKIAPYLGVTYTSSFDQAASMARTRGRQVHALTVTAGLRLWF